MAIINLPLRDHDLAKADREHFKRLLTEAGGNLIAEIVPDRCIGSIRDRYYDCLLVCQSDKLAKVMAVCKRFGFTPRDG